MHMTRLERVPVCYVCVMAEVLWLLGCAVCVSPQDAAADGSMPCIVCQALTSKRCSKCRKLSYCSKGCQASHWRYHRPQCRDDAKPYMDKARYDRE
jgi:hypothetical protein